MIRWQQPVRQHLLRLEKGQQQVHACLRRQFPPTSTRSIFPERSQDRVTCRSNSSSHVRLFSQSSSTCCCTTWTWSISTQAGRPSSRSYHDTGGLPAHRGAENACKSLSASSNIRENGYGNQAFIRSASGSTNKIDVTCYQSSCRLSNECGCSRHGRNTTIRWNNNLISCLSSRNGITLYNHIRRRCRNSASGVIRNQAVPYVIKSGAACTSVAAKASCNNGADRKQPAAAPNVDYHSCSRARCLYNDALHSLRHVSSAFSYTENTSTLGVSPTRGLLTYFLSRALCTAVPINSSSTPVISAIVAVERHAYLTLASQRECDVGGVYSEGGNRATALPNILLTQQPSLQASLLRKQQHQRQQRRQHQRQHSIAEPACLHQGKVLHLKRVRVPEPLRARLRMLHQLTPSRSCSEMQVNIREVAFFSSSAFSRISTASAAAASAAACTRVYPRSDSGLALLAASYYADVNSNRRRNSTYTAAAGAKPPASSQALAHQQPVSSSASSSDAETTAHMSAQQQQTQMPHAASHQPQGRSTMPGSSPPPVTRPRLRGTTNSNSSRWRSFFSVFGLSRLAWRLVVSLGTGLLRGLQTCSKYLRLIISNPMIVKKFWKKGKESAIHTWRWTVTGFSLFYANVRVSYQLLKKKILGHPLRYNEHKLLVRTTADALKLIPFSLMIVIPLGELLLPVMLRLFPNMLPSTFFEKQVDNAYLSRKLKAKQELAAFFQELVREHTKHIIEHESNDALKDKAKALREFQEKLLRKDQKDVNPFLSLKEILSFAKLFKEEFVLEKLDLQTLQVMCKLLGIEPYSLQSHVVLQLRYHLNNIQREDREFMWEGVETLSHDELVEACKDRAMMFHSISDEDMREQMRQWLEISSHKDIPPLLLLWCRCITLTHRPIPPPAVDLKGPSSTTITAAKTAAAAAGAPAGAAAAAIHATETTGIGEKEPGLAATPTRIAPTAPTSLEQQQPWGTDAATTGGHALGQQEAESAAAAVTDNKQQQRDAAAQSLDHHGIPVPTATEDSRAAATTDQQQQQQETGEKPEEEEAEDEDEKIKQATLKAMERQVELLRAEEETLRQSVWLLQEEEAHRKEVQAAEEAERLKSEGFDETAASPSPTSDASSTSSLPDLHPHPASAETDTTDIEHNIPAVAHAAAAHSAAGDSSGRKDAASPATEKGEEQQHVKTRPLGSEEIRDVTATGTAVAATAGGPPSGGETDDDASLNELARVRSGREMLQRRARRMELEIKLLRRLADMQHQQQEQAFGALSKVLQAAHACRTKQQALQQLEQAQVQQRQQHQGDKDRSPASEQLQQHLDAEQGHQQEVQRQQNQQGATTSAAVADFPESVAQLEVCVEDVIRKFAEGVQQVDQLMRDAKRFQMNDTDPLFYPEDHSDMEDICTLSGSWPLSHTEQSPPSVSASSSSTVSASSPWAAGAAAAASPSSVLRFPSSSDTARHSRRDADQQGESGGGGASAEERAVHPTSATSEGTAERANIGESKKKKTAAHGGACA